MTSSYRRMSTVLIFRCQRSIVWSFTTESCLHAGSQQRVENGVPAAFLVTNGRRSVVEIWPVGRARGPGVICLGVVWKRNTAEWVGRKGERRVFRLLPDLSDQKRSHSFTILVNLQIDTETTKYLLRPSESLQANLLKKVFRNVCSHPGFPGNFELADTQALNSTCLAPVVGNSPY